MILSYLEGNALCAVSFNKIPESHSKKKRTVPPTLYPYWIERLIRTLNEDDDQWTPDLEHNWRKVLKNRNTYLILCYDTAFFQNPLSTSPAC